MKEIIQDKPLIDNLMEVENVQKSYSNPYKILNSDDEFDLEEIKYNPLKSEELYKDKDLKHHIAIELLNPIEEPAEDKRELTPLLLNFSNLHLSDEKALLKDKEEDLIEINIDNIKEDKGETCKHSLQVSSIKNSEILDEEEYISYIKQLQQKIENGEKEVLFDKEWYL